MQIVGPGRFFGASWFFKRPRSGTAGAVACEPSLVATVSREVMTNVVAALPPERALQLMAYSWRVLSRVLLEKCLLLTMSLQDRLAYELESLAAEFGRPECSGSGVLIDVALSRVDLAALAVASPGNVSRWMTQRRRDGEIDVVDGRLVLPRLALTA